MGKQEEGEDRAIRARLESDFPHYAAKCLKIRSKKGAIAPLALNAAQTHLHMRLEKQLQEKGRVRAIILKGRQQGCSTYVAARFYWKVTKEKGLRAFILTHLEEASKNIYQIAKRFHAHCPKIVKPRSTLANAKELFFGALDSGCQIGTAKSQDIGRSWTIQLFHGSEVAFWANAEEHVTGILQAVPDEDGTEVILESTSNGGEGMFYKLAQAAAAGQSEYELIFIPWFWQQEYRRKTPDGFALTGDEEDYKARYALDNEQIYWRRIKAQDLGGHYSFRREYPSCVEEAFHADKPTALWTRAQIERDRISFEARPEMRRIVVAVDPAVSNKRGSDETGIIVAGLGTDMHGYVLADLSGKYTPLGWAEAVKNAYEKFDADCVVAEVNQGGEMVEYTLRSVAPTVAYKPVRASRGKVTRAEPVAALNAQGRIHHAGVFERLESQLCGFDPLEAADSPDRLDARVWALTDLMLGGPLPEGPKVWR